MQVVVRSCGITASVFRDRKAPVLRRSCHALRVVSYLYNTQPDANIDRIVLQPCNEPNHSSTARGFSSMGEDSLTPSCPRQSSTIHGFTGRATPHNHHNRSHLRFRFPRRRRRRRPAAVVPPTCSVSPVDHRRGMCSKCLQSQRACRYVCAAKGVLGLGFQNTSMGSRGGANIWACWDRC